MTQPTLTWMSRSFGSGVGVLVLVVVHLVEPDGVAFGDDGPVAGVAVDARDFVGGKLEDFEDLRGRRRSSLPLLTEDGRGLNGAHLLGWEGGCGEDDND